MALLFALFVSIALALPSCAPVSVTVPQFALFNTSIGETPISIATFSFGNPPFDFSFLNLHQNENTSVVAAKALIASSGGAVSGSITYLLHGGTRNLVFQLNGTFSIDPNRMFTAAGRRTYLQPFRADADQAVENFANQVLQVYRFSEQRIVLALHNNGPGYSASSYLPGGEFASAAQSVSIGTLFNPRDFFYVVPGNLTTPLYWCLAKSGLNAVLQVAENPPDDGSLSVYAALHNKDYINTENAAENGGEGDRVIEQLINLRTLTQLINQETNR